jgi:DNA-binding SARP family transcriptional activator
MPASGEQHETSRSPRRQLPLSRPPGAGRDRWRAGCDDPAVADLEVAALGPVTARVDGRAVVPRGAKQRALLATLALHHDSVVGVDTIVAHLWDEPVPDRAEHTLQQHVSSLRKALEPPDAAAPVLLVTREPGYLLHVARLDVDDFRTGVDHARQLAAQSAVEPALDALDRAFALRRGPSLADVRTSMRLDAAAARVDDACDDAAELRVELQLRLGRHREAIPDIDALVDRRPYREGLRAQLMLALYRSGRQSDALAAYRATRTLLVEELGVEPGRPLRDLEQAILRQDPALDRPDTAAADVGRTFRAGDEPYGWIELPDGQAIALTDGVVIGRAPDAAIRLVDSRVSREHARLELDAIGARVVDLDSTNGTTVNEVRVQDHPLRDGDAIGLGGFVVRFRASRRSATA